MRDEPAADDGNAWNLSAAGMDDPEIVSLEARIRAAQLEADVAALDDLIADSLLFTGPDGRLGSKADDLEAYGSGRVRLVRHEPRELRIRRVGDDVAVTALRAFLVVEVDGVTVEGTYRYTRVWAREHSRRWRVVGGHVSAAPSDPADESRAALADPGTQ